MRVLALAMLVVACAAATTMPASAQTVICADEPLLGTFDANGDGILMVGEVREAAPDDERIQSVADQMEAAGLDGIQYRGCDPESGNAGSDGDDNAGSSDGDSTGNQEQATDSDNASGAADTSTSEEPDESTEADATAVSTPQPDTSGETGWFDERLTVTTLPGVGDGPQQGSSGAGVVVLGTALLLTVIVTALWRTARCQARR